MGKSIFDAKKAELMFLIILKWASSLRTTLNTFKRFFTVFVRSFVHSYIVSTKGSSMSFNETHIVWLFFSRCSLFMLTILQNWKKKSSNCNKIENKIEQRRQFPFGFIHIYVYLYCLRLSSSYTGYSFFYLNIFDLVKKQ